MTAPTKPSWHLLSGEDRQRAAPKTFPIPTRDRRYTLTAGDIVQLIFSCEREIDGTKRECPERMWVEITSVNATGSGTLYRGELRNHPVVIDAEWGDLVEFDPAHVINVEKGKA